MERIKSQYIQIPNDSRILELSAHYTLKLC